MDYICISCLIEFEISDNNFKQSERVITCPNCGFTQQIPQEIDEIKSLKSSIVKKDAKLKKPFRVTARWATIGPDLNTKSVDRTPGIIDVKTNLEKQASFEVVEQERSSESGIIEEEIFSNKQTQDNIAVNEASVESSLREKKKEHYSRTIWKVKSPTGIIFNFEAVNILQNWVQSLDNIIKYGISQDNEDWRNLNEFIKLLRQTGSAKTAFIKAKIEKSSESDEQSDEDKTKKDIGSKEIIISEINKQNVEAVEQTEKNKIIKQTSEFTFKINEPENTVGMGRLVIWTIIGMLIGAGVLTIVFLYFFADKA